MTDIKKKEEEEVKVTSEEKKNFLEGLVLKGFAYYEEDILDDKIVVGFRSMSVDEQLSLEKAMADIEGSTTYILRVYAVKLVSTCIVKYGKEDIGNQGYEEREKFIKGLGSPILQILIRICNEFLKKLNAVSTGEAIEEVFFETPSTS